jgi:hypothetical protein
MSDVDPFVNLLLSAQGAAGNKKNLDYAKGILALLPSYQKDYVPEQQAPYQEAPSSVRARYASNPIVSAALDDVDNGKASSIDFAGALLDENGMLTDAAVGQGIKTPAQAEAIIAAVGDYEKELGSNVADKSKYQQTSLQHDLGEKAKVQAAAENDPYGQVPVHELPDVPNVDDLYSLLAGDNADRRQPWQVQSYDRPPGRPTKIATHQAPNGNLTVDTRIDRNVGERLGAAPGPSSWVMPQNATRTLTADPDHYRTDDELRTAASGLQGKLANANQMLSQNNAMRPSKAADTQSSKMALLRMLLGG